MDPNDPNAPSEVIEEAPAEEAPAEAPSELAQEADAAAEPEPEAASEG